MALPQNQKQNLLPSPPSFLPNRNPPSPSFIKGAGGLPVPRPPVRGVVPTPFHIEHRLPSFNPHPTPPPKGEGRENKAVSTIESEERVIYKKVVLVILDGFGVASASHGNAVFHARHPTLDYLVANYPSLTLHASGPLVGLPWGEMGNSEVGHLNIGAGRIVGQDLPRISTAIQHGDFFINKTLLEAVNHASQNNSRLHLLGMVSEGGVHSLDEHLYALLALAEDKGLKKVYIHMFTDGRDTAEKAAQDSLKKLRERIAKIGVGEIATVSGRFYAMDRGGHWNQTDMAYKALVHGEGEIAHSAEDCIWRNYQNGIYDEMIKPTVICEIGQSGQNYPVTKIDDNDSVVFFNFRPDRALQLTQAFVQPNKLPDNYRHPPIKNLYFATMTEYAQDLPQVHVAFEQVNLKNNLAEVIAQKNLPQFHISESEKYAHVTSFFDCGRTDPFSKEERKIVASPDNARNYVDHPEMSAEELADVLSARIINSPTNFFVANFANADMVGHTGSLKSGIIAVEVLDSQLKKLVDASLEAGACLIITADHGNIEQMIDLRTGGINKDHTNNPVPFLIASREFKFNQMKDLNFLSLASRTPDGSIGDIAPTILQLLGIGKPEEMTGVSLLGILNKESEIKNHE